MIEAAIHEILASTSPAATAVTSLLPASRFVTGMQREQDLPYVTINLEANQSEYRSSDGSMRKPSIRFQLWIENHAAGCAIRDAIERLFENKSFNTTNHKLVQTRHENSLAIEEPDGTWQFLIDVIVIATTN
jgi:hypothetical protein